MALNSWVGCILGSTVCLQQGAARVIISTLLCPIWRHPGLKWSHTRLFLLCWVKHNVHSGYGQAAFILPSFPLVCHHNDSESVTVHHHPLTLHFFEPGSAALFVQLLASGPSITASEIPLLVPRVGGREASAMCPELPAGVPAAWAPQQGGWFVVTGAVGILPAPALQCS